MNASVLAEARQAQSEWQLKPIKIRLQLAQRLRKQLAQQADDWVTLICEETQKSSLDALSGDVYASLEMIRYYEKEASRILKPERVAKPGWFYQGSKAEIHSLPRGVVLIISPFNYPLQLALVPAISAVIAGNSVIIKPSEYAPRTGLAIQKLFEESGFPKHLVTVVNGGPDTAQALIQEKPDFIYLTGSSGAGQAVQQLATEHFIPTALELGGNDAMIVLEDAPVERAVSAAVYSAFLNSGQVCASTKRLLIHRTLYAPFREKLTTEVNRLRAAHPSDMNHFDIGPLVRKADVDRIQHFYDEAVRNGARPITAFDIQDRVVKPILLDFENVHLSSEGPELFGPVLTLYPFDTDEEAVSIVNESRTGLGASVWSKDIQRAQRLASSLIVGSACINDVIKNVSHPGLPFGGEKASGWGRTHGDAGLKIFCRMQSQLLCRSHKSRERHWFPHNDSLYRGLRFFLNLTHNGLRSRQTVKTLTASVLVGGLFFLGMRNLRAEDEMIHAPAIVHVQVHSIPLRQGHIAYSVFRSPEGFPRDKSRAVVHRFIETPKEGDLAIDLEFPPNEEIAVAVYLDANDNQKLDKNFLGIPTESIGFSNNPVVRFGPPSFDETKLTLHSGEQSVHIQMIH